MYIQFISNLFARTSMNPKNPQNFSTSNYLEKLHEMCIFIQHSAFPILNSSNEEVFCASYWTVPQGQCWPKAGQGCKIKNWLLPTTICLCLSGHYTSSVIQTSNLHRANERKFVWLEFLDSICLSRRWELSCWMKILINLIDKPAPQGIKMILS